MYTNPAPLDLNDLPPGSEVLLGRGAPTSGPLLRFVTPTEHAGFAFSGPVSAWVMDCSDLEDLVGTIGRHLEGPWTSLNICVLAPVGASRRWQLRFAGGEPGQPTELATVTVLAPSERLGSIIGVLAGDNWHPDAVTMSDTVDALLRLPDAVLAGVETMGDITPDRDWVVSLADRPPRNERLWASLAPSAESIDELNLAYLKALRGAPGTVHAEAVGHTTARDLPGER